MDDLHFQLIHPGTDAYEEMVALRMAVLLDPIGIPRTYINPDKEKHDRLIGAYRTNQLAGCCILTKLDDTVVQLRQMAVASFSQKKGVGRSIVSYAEQLARKDGYRQVRLHARENVVPFYEACGYQTEGNRFFEVGIGHYRMSKTLPAWVP